MPPSHPRHEQETLQNFSPEEVQTLLRLLDRAIENLSETKEEP